jgi:transcription elongation factor GreB
MSRAFVKDDSDAPEPRFERPVSDRPNYVTPHGLTLLKDALRRAEATGDDRQARYVEGRIDTAIVVDPTDRPRGVAEFGARVEAHDDHGNKLRVRIVGEDEADPLNGTISWDSPIAQALSGHRRGERVTVLRPAGPIEFTIDEIAYD